MPIPAVAQADSTVTAIRKKVRRLCGAPSTSQLTDSDLDEAINTFYSQDFPYAIKTDQLRFLYTFYTIPNVDRYPLDIFYNHSVRGPLFFDGILGSIIKTDRQQFYNLWPRWPSYFQQGGTTLTGTITGVTQANPAVVTSPGHNLSNGAVITINNVVGMTQLNGNSYTIEVVDANNFQLVGINSTGFGAYVSGGTWLAISQTFSFVIPGPFLTQEVTIGGIDQNGNGFSIKDDGYGNLLFVIPNAPTSIPAANTNPALPGMYNINTGNPGLQNPTQIGTVNYVTGQMDFTLPSGTALGAGQLLKIAVSQYQVGRPYYMLFWNNEFHVRPVPGRIHKVEVETYLTPIQFMQVTDQPIVQQFWQYLSYGAAREILRERQDLEGVANLEEGFMRQEALVLERQASEEIFVPNYNLFNSTQLNWLNGGWGQNGGGIF